MPIDPNSLPNGDSSKQDTYINTDADGTKYVDLLKPNANVQQSKGGPKESIPMKTVSYNNGIPRVTWTEEEIQKMNIMENLQFVVVRKFSYG